MKKGLAETTGRAGQTRSPIALALLACLLIAGCAQRDNSSDRDQPGGFYSGVGVGKGL